MRIELIKSHINAGQLHAPGEILDLDEVAAQWLIERGVGRLADDQPVDKQLEDQTKTRSKKGG